MTIRKIPQRIPYIAMGLVFACLIGIIGFGVRWYAGYWRSQTSHPGVSSGAKSTSTQLMEFAGWQYITASGDVYLFDRVFSLRIVSTMPRLDTQTGWTYGVIKAQVRGIGTNRLVSDLHSIDAIRTLPLTSIQYAYLTDQADRFVTTKTHYLFHAFSGIIVYVPRSVSLHETALQSFPHHTCHGSWEGEFDDQQVFVMTLCTQPRRASQRAKTDHSVLIGNMIMYIRATDAFYPLNQIMLFPEQEFLSFIPSEEEKSDVDSE